jgi:type II secretory pathway component PulK
MKPMIGFLKNEKGIALLIVLWVMMLLWAIVGEFSYAVKLRLNIIKNFKDNTQSYYFAVAGLNNAIASLLEKEQGPVIPVVGNFIRDIESVIKEEGIEGWNRNRY